MKKLSNKNVIAPDQQVKSPAEQITDYMQHIGLAIYGKSGPALVYHKTIGDNSENLLLISVNGMRMRIRRGIRNGKVITGKMVHSCTIETFDDAMAYLKRLHYL